MKFKTTLLIITALVLCAGLSRYVMACPGISLPAATTGNTMSFGVALVYSLPILGLNVPSSPDPVSDCIVVTTDPNGVLAGTNSAVVNDRYGYGGSPNSHTGNPQSSTGPDQVSKVNGDAAITPDSMLNAFQSFLAGGSSLANFGLPASQTKARTAPSTTQGCTNSAGRDSECTAQDGGAVTSDTAGSGAAASEARGQVCLNGPVGIGTPIPCVIGGDANPAVVVVVNENLGAEHAANAVVSPELSSLLNLANFDIVAVVPEPGTLALFAMGLLVSGLWTVRRRRK